MASQRAKTRATNEWDAFAWRHFYSFRTCLNSWSVRRTNPARKIGMRGPKWCQNDPEGGAAVATRIPSKTEPPEFLLETIREGAEFTLYRARQHGNPSPVLVVAAMAEQPLPQSLRRLEHEYSLAAELEPAWAAKPLALTRHEGRTTSVIADEVSRDPIRSARRGGDGLDPGSRTRQVTLTWGRYPI
jgi:hypothetical protein